MEIIKNLAILLFLLIFISCASNNENEEVIYLKNWEMKSSQLINEEGKELSQSRYNGKDWYSVTVPTTVLNGLVKNKVYPDPRIDMDNFLIPDISDEFNKKYNLAKYSYLPNHENPWKAPYWFRTKFKIPNNKKGKETWLNFDGINYRADVWFNGKPVANSEEMAGMFQRFKFNITKFTNLSDENYLAVKIYPVDNPGVPGTQLKVFGDKRRPPIDDLCKDVTLKISGGWDCAPAVRDRNMGIYQDVYINFTGKVDIRNPYIITDLPLPDTTVANLTISAELVNTSDEVQKGIFKGRIDLIREVDFYTYTKVMPGEMETVSFEKEVEIQAGETVTVSVNHRELPQLSIENPYLWWPNGYGEQYLHNLELSYETDGEKSVQKDITFGIREITNEIIERDGSEGKVGDFGRKFFINGKKVFCKGGWLQPDILLDMNKKRIYDEARLLANANVNMIANEDMPSPTKDFMDACDKYGLMLWEVFFQCWCMVPGTPTADYPLDHQMALKNVCNIIKRYRNHPSLALWCAAVEVTVGPDLYRPLRKYVKELDPTRPFIPASSIWWDWEKLTPYIEDDLPLGMTDHYDPDYTWYPETFFFNKVLEVKWQQFRNELGCPSVPTLSSLKKFINNLGEDKNNTLFPLDSVWAHHGAWDGNGYAFKAYHNAIKNIYGFNSTNVSDYVNIAQLVNYNSYRAMFESYQHRMWDITNGVMLWKLNSCWPSVLWQIYDWYLNPNAAYYATKKACEPIHVQMNAHDFQVSVINTSNNVLSNFKVTAKIYDFNLKLRWEREEIVNIGADRYQEVFSVPQLSKITPVYFVKLELRDEEGKLISSNFYWKSSKTPADLSDLARLSEVKPDLSYEIEEREKEYVINVKIYNSTDNLSFFNHLAIIKNNNGEEVLPTFWEDNFITLLPSEERTLEARFAKEDLGDSTFSVVIDNNR